MIFHLNNMDTMNIEKREFGKIKGHYQLHGNVTPNDYNLALCKLYGINPKDVKGLKEEYKHK